MFFSFQDEVVGFLPGLSWCGKGASVVVSQNDELSFTGPLSATPASHMPETRAFAVKMLRVSALVGKHRLSAEDCENLGALGRLNGLGSSVSAARTLLAAAGVPEIGMVAMVLRGLPGASTHISEDVMGDAFRVEASLDCCVATEDDLEWLFDLSGYTPVDGENYRPGDFIAGAEPNPKLITGGSIKASTINASTLSASSVIWKSPSSNQWGQWKNDPYVSYSPLSAVRPESLVRVTVTST